MSNDWCDGVRVDGRQINSLRFADDCEQSDTEQSGQRGLREILWLLAELGPLPRKSDFDRVEKFIYPGFLSKMTVT